MAESSGSSLLVHGNSHGGHGSALTEESSDGVLSGVESEVSAEHGVGLRGVSTCEGLGLA